jgi:acetylornithine deacetylase/succinyl-diaminopimelate desuccinylase-like protein
MTIDIATTSRRAQRVPRTLFLVVVFVAASWLESSAQRAQSVAALLGEPSIKAAIAAARSGEPRTIEDQIRFCEVPAPPFNENARGDLLRRSFVDAGLQNIRIDRAGNVIADRLGQAPAPRVVLAAHLDTVFPEGTPTKVTRQGGVLRGPGIGDNCRGLAVLVAVVRALDEGHVRTSGPLTFVANVGEEGLGDLRGMKALFNDTMKGRIDRFVSLDNGGIWISTIGVGSLRYRFTISGPGGHSFADFGHANPATALGRAIAQIGDIRVPANPRTTFNVGRIGGGTSVNAIPEDAWMEIDLRSSDPVQLADLDARIQRAVEAAVRDENARAGQLGAIRVRRERVGDRPAGQVPMSAPIVQTAQAVARALGLQAPISESSSDANLPMSLGIPAIAIGAGGQSYDAHAVSEWFDATDAWQGTENALLLAVALAQP